MLMLIVLFALLMAYLIGSIPSAVIVCRICKLPDPRQHGSLNPGTTNVLRIGGKKAALMTLLADALKGFLPVFLCVRLISSSHLLSMQTTQWIGAAILLCAFIGHLFPVFARFQGGKGVATMLGGLFGLSLLIGVAVVLTWLIIAAATRYSSLAAMISAILAPVYAALFATPLTWIPIAVLSIILLWRHKHNIQRLISGTESKIGKKAK